MKKKKQQQDFVHRRKHNSFLGWPNKRAINTWGDT